MTKVFHGQSKEVKDSDKWDWYSEDDDALIAFKRDGSSPKFVIGNIQEIIVLNQVPSNKKNLTAGDALRNGEPKGRIPLDFDPERVAMLVQTYEEVDKDGKVLADYCHKDQVYYKLPVQAQCAPDYWLSETMLGHVRMSPVEKINGQTVSRMYKETAASDRADLVAGYLDQ